MPGPLLPAAIAAAGTLAGAGVNAYAQGKMNRRTEKYNERMFAIQRFANQRDWEQQNQYNEEWWNRQNQWDLQMWERENAYNSPMAQMQRFREAGLNPNVIYGQSNTGGSIATANFQSDQKANTNAQSWNPTAPHFDFQNGIMSYFQARESAARVNNLEVQNSVLQQDAIKRMAETQNVIANTEGTKYDTSFKQRIADLSVDAMEASLRKTNIESAISLKRDEREALMNSSNLREAAERILNMRDQRMTNEVDRMVKALDAQLKDQQFQWNKENIMRVVPSLLAPILNDVKDGIKNSYEMYKYFSK